MREWRRALMVAGVALGLLSAGGRIRAQGTQDGTVPSPGFGGTPEDTRPTKPPVVLNRETIIQALIRECPAEAWQTGGIVHLWVLVDALGDLKSARISVTSGKPALDAAALRVAAQMRFAPGERDGVPIDVWLGLPLHFLPSSRPPVAAQRAFGVAQRDVRLPGGDTPLQETHPDDDMTFSPSSSTAASLLNRRYVLRTLRQEYEARFPSAPPRGKTVLRLSVDTNGNVAGREVQKGSGNAALDSLALGAVARMVFVPAIQTRQYAPGVVSLPIPFPLPKQ